MFCFVIRIHRVKLAYLSVFCTTRPEYTGSAKLVDRLKPYIGALSPTSSHTQ